MTDAVYALLDANVLLHFQPPSQIDWPALCSGRPVYLVIYPLLRTEVSNAKATHPMKHIRARAGERGDWIREALQTSDLPVRQDVFLVRISKEPRDLLMELGLDRNVHDDLIIAHALSLQNEGKKVVVVTADGGLEMKLEDRQVRVIGLPDVFRLAAEQDPEKTRADRFERELRDLRNRLPSFSLVPATPIVLRRQQGFGTLEEYIRRGLELADEGYKEAQRRHYNNAFQPYDTIYSPRHRAQLDFLANQHRWATKTENAEPISLVLTNTGTHVATNVRVRLRSPHGTRLQSFGGFGLPPGAPNLSEAFRSLPSTPTTIEPPAVFRSENLDGTPKFSAETGLVEITWSRISHDAEIRAEPFWLIAATSTSIGNAALNVQILCDEKGKCDDLHIPLSVSE